MLKVQGAHMAALLLSRQHGKCDDGSIWKSRSAVSPLPASPHCACGDAGIACMESALLGFHSFANQ